MQSANIRKEMWIYQILPALLVAKAFEGSGFKIAIHKAPMVRSSEGNKVYKMINITTLSTYDQPINYDAIAREGISIAQASERSKITTDEIVEEYLTKGAIADNVVNLALDTFLPEDSETKEKALASIESFKQSIAENDIIPSENTLMSESGLGNALKAFGKVIELGSEGLQLVGVPKDDADQIAALVSLKAAPAFTKVVAVAKSRVGYTDAVNKVYGDILRVPLLKSDKKKAEQAVGKLQTDLNAFKERNKDEARFKMFLMLITKE